LVINSSWCRLLTRNPKDLVAYCGLYCGACGIYQGRIRHAVENLRKVIGAYGFDKIAPELAKWEPSLQHYSEFEKVMDGLVKLFGECPACIGDGGDPNCAIRQCCRQKKYATCVECAEMDTCGTLQRYLGQERSYRKSRLRALTNGLEKCMKKWTQATAP